MDQLIASSDNAVAAKLCEILANLLVPDSNVIEQATSGLRELNGHASFVPSLFSVLCQASEAETRKLAALIFRRKVSRQWRSFSRHVCIGVRQAVLERLLLESDVKVSQSLCQISAAIAKHELRRKDGSWPDLFEVIKRSLRAPKSREIAVYLLSTVCETAGENLEAQYITLLELLRGTIENCEKDIGNTEIYALKAFNSLIPYLGDEYVNLVRPLVLKCVYVTQELLEKDESQAAEVMEVFETLIETEVSFISPHVKDLVLFSLQVASKKDFEDSTRVRALSLLRWIIKMKKKAVIKLALISPILETLFPIITASCNEEEEVSFASDDVESQDPITSSLYIIDELALHLPPEKLFKEVMPRIEILSKSSEPSHSHGLVLILACLAEGTSEYIKNNHLKGFLEIVCRSSQHSSQSVRNASLFALGQFSEHLQPDINNFSSEVMPLLFDLLQKTTEKNKGITRAYYALENFVENLGDGVLVYLPQLMTHLLGTLQSCSLVHTRELVVSAIGAVANAAKENLLPYLSLILSQLQICLPKPEDPREQKENEDEDVEQLSLLHMQTLDTLGVLARTVGKANFLPLAEDCLKLGLQLVEREDNDPDMKRSAYGLFSAIATIVGDKLAPFLSVIVNQMIESLRSAEGVTAHYNDEVNGDVSSKDFSFLDDNTDDDLTTNEEADEAEDIEGFSVENSYMDEKSDACEALGEIAKYTGSEFVPYFEAAFKEVFALVDFPHSDVRKASVACCGELTMCAHKLKQSSYSSFLDCIFPVICKTITRDEDRQVVMAAIATANQMVECCGQSFFANGKDSLEELVESLHLVMSGKSSCQDGDEDDDDEQQAEYDEMLIEYCGEILPVLAASLGESFLPYFIRFLPPLIGKMKPSCTANERSFAAGTVAETFQKLGPAKGGPWPLAKEIVGHLVPVLLKLASDSEAEVRNNSIFCIGVVLQTADSASLPFYPTVLQNLSQTLASEQSRQVTDNIIGAVARMILANPEAVPVAQVVPVLLQHLPITKDHEEDRVVYSCLCRLLHDKSKCDVTMKMEIASLFEKVIAMEEVEKEIRDSLFVELKNLQE